MIPKTTHSNEDFLKKSGFALHRYTVLNTPKKIFVIFPSSHERGRFTKINKRHVFLVIRATCRYERSRYKLKQKFCIRLAIIFSTDASVYNTRKKNARFSGKFIIIYCILA